MSDYSRKWLAQTWMKNQHKSGSRVPFVDEIAAADELDNLYSLLQACEEHLSSLPVDIQALVRDYHQEGQNFAKYWEQMHSEHEKFACKKCRTRTEWIERQYDEGVTMPELVCPHCHPDEFGWAE